MGEFEDFVRDFKQKVGITKRVVVKKEGYMLGAKDESAEILQETLGYKLYNTPGHIKTGFPIVGYETVKKRLSVQGIDLYVEDMSEEEIYNYIVDHNYTVSFEEEDETLSILNALLEGRDPTTGHLIERNSFLYDVAVQNAIAQARDVFVEKTSKKRKKLKKQEKTILYKGIHAIVDDDGEIQTNMELFEELRAWRWQTAKKDKISPFMVFHDKALVAFATYCPLNRGEFLQIYGVGEHKYKKYGEDVMQIIAKYRE